MMRIIYFAALLVAITFSPLIHCDDGYADPSSAQYHIQTDEGPERYFRYQTISGQYRKEKRLEDGSVIGSYGWVDDDGYLRMKDYMADKAGYRILKTKNVYVGRNRPISQALSIAKKAPSEGGVVPPQSAIYNRPAAYTPPPTNYNTAPNSYSVPIGYSTQHLQQPVIKYGTVPYDGYSTSSYTSHNPYVQVSPNSIPSTTPSPIENTYSSTPTIPASTFLPPLLDDATSTSSVPETNYPTSTPPTVYIPSTTPAPTYGSSTVGYSGLPAAAPNYIAAPVASSLPPQINSNSLDASYYSSDPQYEHYPENEKPFINPYIFHNGPTYPIDKNGHIYDGHLSKLSNDYDAQVPKYDGVSVTNDGFRYYIPKQYHEEKELADGQKSGSFGYVDPFGIRRVIYYNAGPDGFKHRKSNKFVGLNAAPYEVSSY